MRIAATLIAALSLCATAAWCILDRTPPSWDDGYYLTKSLELYDTLGDRGAFVYAGRFLKIMSTKPPLIAALPTPVYLLVGRRHRAAYAVNLFFLALMFASVYGIAASYAGGRAGVIAVAVLGAMPVIYGLSHWYLVECGLVALVCAAVHVMAGWSESSGAGRAIVLGIVFALGMLMKASFPVYVALPFLYLMWRWGKTPLLPMAVAVAVLAGPWYVANLRAMITTVLNAGSAQTAKIYDTGEALSVRAIGHYLFDVANVAPWLFVAVIPILGVAGAPGLIKQTRRGLIVAALWLAPLVLLALGHYRDIRYAAPLYPAAALLFGWMADAAIRRRGAVVSAAVGLVLLLGWISMIQNSFGGPGPRMELGGLLLNAPRFSYARVYDHAAWPQREILADVYRGGETRAILLGTNSLRFNADNFKLSAVEGRFPFEIDTTAYFSDASGTSEALNRAAWFIYKEGGEPDQVNFNGQGGAAIRLARDGGKFSEVLSRTLPDRGVVHVLRKKPAGGALLRAGLDEVPTCSVKFADELALAGIGVSQTSAGIEVKYRWRCLKTMTRDYWCFTHVMDRQGKILAYLDHPILDGDPPTHVWNPGDTAAESRSAAFSEPAYELRVGVFHRESGERLPIAESSFTTVQEHTAVVVPAKPAR